MIGLRQYSISGIVSASALASSRAAANIRRPLYAEEEEQPRELVQGGSRQLGGSAGPPQAQGHQTKEARWRAGGPSDRSGLLGASQGQKALERASSGRAFRSAGVRRRAHLPRVGPAHSQKSAIKPWLSRGSGPSPQSKMAPSSGVWRISLSSTPDPTRSVCRRFAW